MSLSESGIALDWMKRCKALKPASLTRTVHLPPNLHD